MCCSALSLQLMTSLIKGTDHKYLMSQRPDCMVSSLIPETMYAAQRLHQFSLSGSCRCLLSWSH